MKLSLLQENFSPALSHVSRFVATKAQLPILNNILLSTDSGRLKLSATNLELGINFWLGSKIDAEGQITIPAKDITEFVSYLPAGRLDLSVNENSLLTISSAQANSTFATAPVSDFPSLPQINPEKSFELPSDYFIQSIQQVAFSAAVDDSRPVLTAILCIFTNEEISFIATDGFRLSIKKIKLVNPLDLKDESLTLLIPSRTLLEITKLAKTNEKVKIGLSHDEHQLIFVLEDLELVSRLIEGDFPDYQRIVPQGFTTKIFINRSEFTQAVKLASVFARQSANVVKLSVNNKGITLSANAPQIGQNLTQVEAKVEGEPLDIAFNYKFISDFLNVCKGDEIVLELNQSLSPGLFRDQTEPDFSHIIMPVRLQD